MQIRTARVPVPTKRGEPVRGWRTIPTAESTAVVQGIRYTNGVYRDGRLIATPPDNLLVDVGEEVDRTDLQRWVNDHRDRIAESQGFAGDTIRQQAWVVQNLFPPGEESPHWTYHLIPLTYACIDRSLWLLPRDGLMMGGVPLIRYQREGEMGNWLRISVECDDSYPAPPQAVWLDWLGTQLSLTLNRWDITIQEQPGVITFDCKHLSQFTAEGNPVIDYQRSRSSGQIIHTVSFERPISQAEWEVFVETRAFYYGYDPCGYGPAQWKPSDPESLDAEGKTCTWLYTHWNSCD